MGSWRIYYSTASRSPAIIMAPMPCNTCCFLAPWTSSTECSGSSSRTWNPFVRLLQGTGSSRQPWSMHPRTTGFGRRARCSRANRGESSCFSWRGRATAMALFCESSRCCKGASACRLSRPWRRAWPICRPRDLAGRLPRAWRHYAAQMRTAATLRTAACDAILARRVPESLSFRRSRPARPLAIPSLRRSTRDANMTSR
mmetsp:Transcript_96434/g.241802  ORF Transcript_96434/g.241802 Transcript_96434/m.241802 type:complete len:200 (+) Transcript_96434:440-1039(+)